ncbi:MAG TPA: M28 family metallopeptidase [Steroidobacter sp.]|uniref:M28 family metallopeptidase n=1 Tax=Steroidobacter sp. TaxID=1978227 RepID=UPI002EDBB6A2
MMISNWIARLAMLAAAGFAAVIPGQASTPAQPDVDRSATNIRSHMNFLASDLLQGREAGSDGYQIAAEYVASHLAQFGATPAGENGTYFQTVPMVAYRPAEHGSLALRKKSGAVENLEFGKDFLPGRHPTTAELTLDAPAVFVGYGVVAPERGRDDYKGLDVRDKLVVVLSGAPSSFPGEERAYYGSGGTKRMEAERRGAKGIVIVNTPSDEKRRPFESSVKQWQAWGMSWEEKDGTSHDVARKTPVIASISAAGAPKLFAGSRVKWDRIVADAEKPAGSPARFELPLSIEVSLRTEQQRTTSVNVAGLIEGSDAVLKKEVVVLMAHLDHIGLTPGEDDPINNGAIDNAAGVATLLEVARAFQASGRPARRSILILAVTAEEKGLVGSDYFARHPTVSSESLSAVVNLDMPVLTYDFTDVVAFGAGRSTIEAAVLGASQRVGVALSPDPLPEEGVFTRSDHYRFVQQGVPSIMLMTGFQNGGQQHFSNFLKSCYHKPCDDLSLPINYAAGAKFARLNYEIARELANSDERARWNAGDFFATKYAEAR